MRCCSMTGLKAVFKREFTGYFATPLAYVLIAIFLLVSGAFTFYLSQFYERGQADLQPFFLWHPWLYLFLMPAISMRLWAEEKKSGTLELLITLPVPLWQLVLGKYLAALAFSGVALVCSFGMWLTVSWLGDPDHGVIFAGYLGSWLLAASYLAVGSCLSALTRNQVIAFVLSLVTCFAFTLIGFPLFINLLTGWMPQSILTLIGQFSLLSHYQAFTQGLMEVKSLLFFLSLIAFWLLATVLALAPARDDRQPTQGGTAR